MADKNFGHTYHYDDIFKLGFEEDVKNTFEDELACDLVLFDAKKLIQNG